MYTCSVRNVPPAHNSTQTKWLAMYSPPPPSSTVKPFDQQRVSTKESEPVSTTESEARQFADKELSPRDGSVATGADRDGSGDTEVTAKEEEIEKAASCSEPSQDQPMETDQLDESRAQETKKSRLETTL